MKYIYMIVLSAPLFASQGPWNSPNFDKKIKLINYSFFEGTQREELDADLQTFLSIYTTALDYFYKTLDPRILKIDFSRIDEDFLSKNVEIPIDFKTALLSLKILDNNKLEKIFTEEQRKLFFKIIFKDFLLKNELKQEKIVNLKKILEKICPGSEIYISRYQDVKGCEKNLTPKIAAESELEKIIKDRSFNVDNLTKILTNVKGFKIKSDLLVSIYTVLFPYIKQQEKRNEVLKLIFSCVDHINDLYFILEDLTEEITQETVCFIKSFLKDFDSNLLMKVLDKAAYAGNRALVKDVLLNDNLKYNQNIFKNIISSCFSRLGFVPLDGVLEEFFLYLNRRQISFKVFELESENLWLLKPYLHLLDEESLEKILIRACYLPAFNLQDYLVNVFLTSKQMNGIVAKILKLYQNETNPDNKRHIEDSLEEIRRYTKDYNLELDIQILNSMRNIPLFRPNVIVSPRDSRLLGNSSLFSFPNRYTGLFSNPGDIDTHSASTPTEIIRTLKNEIRQLAYSKEEPLLSPKKIVQCAFEVLDNFLGKNTYLLPVLKDYAEKSLVVDKLRSVMMTTVSKKYKQPNAQKRKIEESFFKYLFENWVANAVNNWHILEQEALEFVLKHTPDSYLKTNFNPFAGFGSCTMGERSRTVELTKAIQNEAFLYDSITPNYTERVYKTYVSVLQKIFNTEHFLYDNENIKNKIELENKINEYIEGIMPNELKKFITKKIFRLPMLDPVFFSTSGLYDQEIKELRRIEEMLQSRSSNP